MFAKKETGSVYGAVRSRCKGVWRVGEEKGHAQKKGRSVRYGTGLKKYLELTVPTTKE